MKISKYVLIHDEQDKISAKNSVKTIKEKIVNQNSAESTSTISKPLLKQNLGILKALSSNNESSSYRISMYRGPKKDDKINSLTLSVRDTSKTLKMPKPISIGLWDIGAWLGSLPKLIDSMNSVQNLFVFFETKASVPIGIINKPEYVVNWISKSIGKKLKPDEKKDIQKNIIYENFFPLAENIRKNIGIDYLLGITPSMIAGKDGDSIYWNHFSSSSNKCGIVSLHELRNFSQVSHIPFLTFLGILVISGALAMIFPKLDFHQNTGCLFDYNEDRVSLITIAKNPVIKDCCIKLIDKKYRSAVDALLLMLQNFKEE